MFKLEIPPLVLLISVTQGESPIIIFNLLPLLLYL
jgi:hypothetical protein